MCRLPCSACRGDLLQRVLDPLESPDLPLDAFDLKTGHAFNGVGRGARPHPERQQLLDLPQGEAEALRAFDEAVRLTTLSGYCR